MNEPRNTTQTVKKSYNFWPDFLQKKKEAPESLLYEGKKGKDDLYLCKKYANYPANAGQFVTFLRFER